MNMRAEIFKDTVCDKLLKASCPHLPEVRVVHTDDPDNGYMPESAYTSELDRRYSEEVHTVYWNAAKESQDRHWGRVRESPEYAASLKGEGNPWRDVPELHRLNDYREQIGLKKLISLGTSASEDFRN